MSTFRVDVVELEAPRPHPNADRLELVDVFGWQCVVGKGDFTQGDLAIYIPLDAIVPEPLAEEYGLEYLKKNGRVRAVRLRGEMSYGILLALHDRPLRAGDEVSARLGITKWEPIEPAYNNALQQKKAGHGKGSRKGITLNPWFHKYTDIENIKYFPSAFQEGEQVFITEKLHGSSVRYSHLRRHARTPWDRFKLRFSRRKTEFVYGSRNVQLGTSQTKGMLYYGTDIYAEMLTKYPQLRNLPLGFTVYGEIVGCLAFNTPVLMADGTKRRIGELVNNNAIGAMVMSYNTEKQRLEPRPIIGVSRRPSVPSEWITVTHKRRRRGGRETTVKMTKNHIVYTAGMREISAGDLRVGDTVYIRTDEQLNAIQEQLILGSALGDAHVTSSNTIAFAHSAKQKEYLYLKHRIMGAFANDISSHISGHGSLMFQFSTKSIHNAFRFDIEALGMGAQRSITKEWLRLLGPIGLAFWYMDDGSLNIHPNPSHSPVSVFATMAYDVDEIKAIKEFFEERGIECSVINIHSGANRGKQTLRLTPRGTKVLHSIIAPFVPSHMQYKLLPEYRMNATFWDHFDDTGFGQEPSGVIPTVITDIKEGAPYAGDKSDKYDLEIEGNHNFFANNMLVHNSGVQDLTYGLDDRDLYVYDLAINGVYQNPVIMKAFCAAQGLKTVPILYEGPYDPHRLSEWTEGHSTICPTQIREGCVVKPQEETTGRMGRKVLKSISPAYLLRKDGTEFH